MKMLLIDGNSMLFRGFYATYYTNLMKTSDGIYTNAVFAFANMINKAIDMIHPEYCVVAFDKGKHTFRHDLAADYKGTRKAAPEELVPQFAMVREYLAAYHIPYIEYDDIEADDIIGSITKKYPDVEVAVLTSDRDMLQLIDDTTRIYLMKKGLSDLVCMDEKALLAEWGVTPGQVPDLKGLMGDSSDNIKGVAGIGPKTATKLIKEYGSVENIYENIDKIKGKIRENLLNDKENCFLSKTLATIKTDVAISLPLEDLRLALDITGVNAFYQKYEMLSLIKRAPVQNITTLTKRVDHVSQELLKAKTFIYLDTDGFSYYEPKIYGLAFANENGAEYIPFEDFMKDEASKRFLASDEIKATYNLKFLLHAFAHYKLDAGRFDDLMLMSFLKNNYLDSIDALFLAYGHETPVVIEEVYGTPKKPKLTDSLLQSKRALQIAQTCFTLMPSVYEDLISEDMLRLYTDLELPLTMVLFKMEQEGIRCDSEVLDRIGQETMIKIEEAKANIYQYARHEFNINSPKQLAEVLFDEMGLPSNKKRSTSAEYLLMIKDYNPIIDELLAYRKYSKLYSSYAEGLKKYIMPDGKIHTIFSQTITQTGRLSSYDPNLQNISVRDEDGKIIRKAFSASDHDHILISSDYSQIELRVLSAMSKEEKMIEAFNHHIDIHTKTAMDIFGLTVDEVNDEYRRKAKAINFGVVYGISDFGLAKQTSLSIIEAKGFINDYFLTYPKIKRFLDESKRFCEENGYVTTIMNRRRYIDEIKSSNHAVKEFARRAAMNSRVQGSAADLIKVAMINIQNEIEKRQLRSKMVLQIHDELIFDVLIEEKEVMIDLINKEMKGAMNLGVTLDNSLSAAYTWYDAK